jgi:hypothetical protein
MRWTSTVPVAEHLARPLDLEVLFLQLRGLVVVKTVRIFLPCLHLQMQSALHIKYVGAFGADFIQKEQLLTNYSQLFKIKVSPHRQLSKLSCCLILSRLPPLLPLLGWDIFEGKLRVSDISFVFTSECLLIPSARPKEPPKAPSALSLSLLLRLWHLRRKNRCRLGRNEHFPRFYQLSIVFVTDRRFLQAIYSFL